MIDLDAMAQQAKAEFVTMARNALREILRDLGTSDAEINRTMRSQGQKRRWRTNGRSRVDVLANSGPMGD